MRGVLLGLFLACLGLTVAAAIAVHVQASPTVDCVLPQEAPWVLDLSKPGDRAHWESDLASVRHIADRYRAYVRTVPLASDGIDARRTYAARPDRAYAYCVAILTDQLARTHHADLDESQTFTSPGVESRR